VEALFFYRYATLKPIYVFIQLRWLENMLEIIESCLSGNQFAQKRLYELFVKSMFRLCRRYVENEQDAEEVLMNGFLKFYKNLKAFKLTDENSLERWLRQIMINECLLFIRQRKIKFSSIEIIENEVQEPEFTNLETDDLYNILLTLPIGYRTVFNLFAIEGYSHAEIAIKLNISEGTSKSQLSRARELLQKILVKNGFNNLNQRQK